MLEIYCMFIVYSTLHTYLHYYKVFISKYERCTTHSLLEQNIGIFGRDSSQYSDGDPFCLLANCFLLVCSELAVLIFPTLLSDIQRPI